MKATPEDVAKLDTWPKQSHYFLRASMKATPEDVAKRNAQPGDRQLPPASMKATPEDVAKVIMAAADERMYARPQ